MAVLSRDGWASWYKTSCLCQDKASRQVAAYPDPVPKLWNETVEEHKRDVRAAILDTAASLVEERGALAVTMSEIAERTGIGRATLYKYFSDVEAILVAWHEHHVEAHLERLAAIGGRSVSAGKRLEAVLEGYAQIVRERHRSDVSALLHRDEHVAHAQLQLHSFVRDLLVEGAKGGDLRNDVAADELASYCLHALMAASTLPSKAAVRRLVAVTLTGLRPPHGP